MILAIFTSLTERKIRGMKEGERNDDRGEKQKMQKEYSVQGERE
jgi:hypothetical protein